MDKITIFVGIDISKDTIDVYDSDAGHFQFENNPKGFSLLRKRLSADHWCAMEATGCYHQRLAIYLYEHGIRLSVLNPLVVKRFIQMKLNHVKTDKSDARMIFRYASEQPLSLWVPEAGYVVECKRYQSAIRLYFKQRTALKNMLHSLLAGGQARDKLVRSIKRQIKNLDKEIGLLEIEMEQLIKSNEQGLYSRLNTIPGIGRKTAMILIVSTNGFRDFESASQVTSFFGLAPNERSSGSSVKGRTRISKIGDPLLRNHLFLCSFTASVHNPQCKALFDRIVGKGKSKKLALIAVCNKLIKQAYGISKSGLDYDRNFVGRLS
ncbi:IS110 family transposase [Maribacter sp. MAR_2009_72]|uniref:IS110 family transposase n=1 Tax=Maribacter sp. MAR_2009_72 TaxID=1250050 RepID=UPI001199C197|nr:IS110 family transposase [Maribacter sp. MAR_2009_72]TVZ15597.1 transposase [Maribacter sp. MAR_2009_72]TVZ15609.1 transposase [Maribacter sp. MAR_2009_72]